MPYDWQQSAGVPTSGWWNNPSGAIAQQNAANSNYLSAINQQQAARNIQSLGGVNTGGVPGIESLTKLVNDINIASQQKANVSRIPGEAGLETTSSQNISNALQGQLDPSVIQQLGQRAAERGTMTGSPTGPGTNAEYLRSLGLTALDLQNQGQNWLTSAVARNPAAPIYNAGNQVLTAEQRAQYLAEQQRLAMEQQRMAQQLALQQAGQFRGGGGGIASGGGGYSFGFEPTDLASWERPEGPAVGGTGMLGINYGGGGYNPNQLSGDEQNWLDQVVFQGPDAGGQAGNYDLNWQDFGGMG